VEQHAAALAEQFEKQARETIQDLSQKARTQDRQDPPRVSGSGRVARADAGSADGRPGPREIGRRSTRPLEGRAQVATVRRVFGETVEVDAGFLKMRVSRTDIDEVLPPATAPGAKPAVSLRQTSDLDYSYREINVIGQRAEQACEQVDKMLDSAALAQVERVRIIHGHGMGILKRAVADLLKDNPHVAKFYAAGPEEGGAGATIVELKV